MSRKYAEILMAMELVDVCRELIQRLRPRNDAQLYNFGQSIDKRMARQQEILLRKLDAEAAREKRSKTC